MKMKSYRNGQLPSQIQYFVERMSNEDDLSKSQIIAALNAKADTFLSVN